MLRAVVFDLDGVLINSEPLMRFAFETVYRRIIGDEPAPVEQYLEHMGESFPAIMRSMGLPLSLWQPYRELCQRHVDRIELFPGCREALNWAVDRGLRLAILTGKDRQRTLQILDRFRLGAYFSCVVASDQLQRPKPDPEGMHAALHQLACPPAEALMVGDAVSDIVCAQQAGVEAIAVTWGIKPERVRRLCTPDYIVHSFAELQSLFQALLAGERLPALAQPPASYGGLAWNLS